MCGVGSLVPRVPAAPTSALCYHRCCLVRSHAELNIQHWSNWTRSTHQSGHNEMLASDRYESNGNWNTFVRCGTFESATQRSEWPLRWEAEIYRARWRLECQLWSGGRPVFRDTENESEHRPCQTWWREGKRSKHSRLRVTRLSLLYSRRFTLYYTLPILPVLKVPGRRYVTKVTAPLWRQARKVSRQCECKEIGWLGNFSNPQIESQYNTYSITWSDLWFIRHRLDTDKRSTWGTMGRKSW